MNIPNEVLALLGGIGVVTTTASIAAHIIHRRQLRQLAKELAPNRQLLLMPPAQEQRLLAAPESEEQPQ